MTKLKVSKQDRQQDNQILDSFLLEDLKLLNKTEKERLRYKTSSDVEHKLHNCKISELGNVCQELVNEFGPDAVLKTELKWDYGDEYIRVEVEHDFIETEEAWKKRLEDLIQRYKDYEAQRKDVVAREKEELRRLTKKYGVPKNA